MRKTSSLVGGIVLYLSLSNLAFAASYPLSNIYQQLLINEVLYRQSGTNSTAANDEAIELYNAGNTPIDLRQLRLIDGNLFNGNIDGTSGNITGNTQPFTFTCVGIQMCSGSHLLAPNAYAVIWIGQQGSHTSAPHASFQAWLGQAPKLNNGGDDLWLYEQTGAGLALVDYLAYGSSLASAVNNDSPDFWDFSYSSFLQNTVKGQSISRVPQGNLAGANCWEATGSGDASGHCTNHKISQLTDPYPLRQTNLGNANSLPDHYRIQGRIFNDSNANGSDDGESGLGEVGVVLHDTVNNTCQTVRSAANGSYQFTGVENGDYVVYEAATANLPAPATCPPAANDSSDFVSTTANQQSVTVAGADMLNVDFGDARAPRFEPSHSGMVLPNSSVVYPHRFVTYADGQVAVNIIEENADPATLTWSSQLFLDANCDGVLNSTDAPLTTARTLSAGDSLCLLVKVLSPANLSSGAKHTLTLQSEWMYGDGLLANQPANDRQTRQDITTAVAGTPPTSTDPRGEGKLSLQKSVWNVTRGIEGSVALPGETLRYTIRYENIGNGALNELVINDSVPEFTQLVPGSLVCTDTPPELPACATNAAANDGLSWRWNAGDELLPGSSGSVIYEVVME